MGAAEEHGGRIHVDPKDLPIRPTATWTYRSLRLLLWPLLHGGLIRVRVTGRENVPAGAYIAIANHLHPLDAAVLSQVLPTTPRLHILGDPDAFARNPILWWVIRRVGGLIPVDRALHGDEAVRQRVLEALDRGCGVLLFPEGHLGNTEGQLLDVKKGFAHFASQAGVPIVPIGTRGMRSLGFLRRVHVTIGRAILPADQSIDALVASGRDAMTSLMAAPERPAITLAES